MKRINIFGSIFVFLIQENKFIGVDRQFTMPGNFNKSFLTYECLNFYMFIPELGKVLEILFNISSIQVLF